MSLSLSQICSSRSQTMKDVKNLLFIVFGMAIYALGFCVFILPHHVVIGGMAGLGTLVFYATGGVVPVAVTMYGTNVLLLIGGYKYLGKGFVLRTIFGATTLSLMIGSMEGYFTSHPAIVTDPTMSVVIGAVMIGMGIGVYYSHQGTAGGTDIVAAIMSTISDVSVGRVMMSIDMTLVALSFFLPFEGDLEARVQLRSETIIYGWLAIFLYSYITDRFLEQGHQTVQFIILSDKWERIADRITHETGRGVTTWDCEGFWTKTGRQLMLVWCREMDTYKMYRIIKEEDPNAYITNSFVRCVYGNGFDTLKIKKGKESIVKYDG
ncbi:MAG: YitT family protein [Duncaniella sp.]|nr:YitT family protein [Muribaculum sp.]MCM1255576.1 YitT family protein [Duncaniella sp.]